MNKTIMLVAIAAMLVGSVLTMHMAEAKKVKYSTTVFYLGGHGVKVKFKIINESQHKFLGSKTIHTPDDCGNHYCAVIVNFDRKSSRNGDTIGADAIAQDGSGQGLIGVYGETLFNKKVAFYTVMMEDLGFG